jgi:hypothetical protein
MSRNTHTANRRRTAAGIGVVTGAAFAAGFIGLGTAATAGAVDGGDGGAAGVTADQIQAVLSGAGVTNDDFTGDTTVANVATALANGDGTDVFGDNVTAGDVHTALGSIGFADGSDVTTTVIADDLNAATVAEYHFPDGNLSPNEGDTPVDNQGYSALFGAEDLNSKDGTISDDSIGGHNASLDASLYGNGNSDLSASFFSDVQEFEQTDDHPFADLFNIFDPGGFTTQTFDGIDGTVTDDGGYLVPTDAFGFLATGLDYALTGTGLTYLLDPAVNLFGAALTDLGSDLGF